MKRNFKKVEDFKNLPVAKATNEFSVAEGLDILMANEISNIMGGKHKEKQDGDTNRCWCISGAGAKA